MFTSDLSIANKYFINGFCVSYLGKKNLINVGFYKDNKRNGNWMSINGSDFSVIESGWYRKDQKVKPFDIKNKGFKISDIFVEDELSKVK